MAADVRVPVFMKPKNIFLFCFLGIGTIAVVYLKLPLTDRVIDGPSSPNGLSTKILISDTGILNFLGDGYVDISVYSEGGDLMGEFEDPSGEDNHVDVIRLLRSLRWNSPNVMAFRTIHGVRSLRIASFPDP